MVLERAENYLQENWIKKFNYSSSDEIYFFQQKKVIPYSVYDDVQFEIIRLSKS